MRPPSSVRPSHLMPPTQMLSAISGPHFNVRKRTARRKTHTIGPSKPRPQLNQIGRNAVGKPQTWRQRVQDQHHADRPAFRLTSFRERVGCQRLAIARDRRMDRIYRAGYTPFVRHSTAVRYRAQHPHSLIRFCRNVASPLFRRRTAPNRYARRLQSCRFPFANTGVNHKMSQENWGE